MKSNLCLAVFVLFACVVPTSLQAAEKTTTVITVKKMHCAGCAKRMAAKLYEVRGVTAVHFSVKHKTLQVTPQRRGVLSPRALWEAIEKADDQPVRLAGPSGTFTSKPRF